MSAILPSIPIDRDSMLERFFAPYQMAWIQAEDHFHAQGRQVFALAEKSVRIGWTFCDGFKNVRKRLRYKKRDYLFATKDLPSALEFMNLCYDFTELLDFTKAILVHGEDYLKVPRFDPDGKPTGFTDEIKIGLIKFDNGSRIIAFSSNPRAMAVYGGDVGIDEFAKHPNAKLLWETAQGRVAWGGDLALWSAHDGEDTLFNQFAQQARAACSQFSASSYHVSRIAHHVAPIENQKSKIENSSPPATPSLRHSISPWNLYFRVTMPDALELGLLNVINQTRGTQLTAGQFTADCQARSGSDEIFQQSYLCNPLGATAASVVEWSAIERCRQDYEIERVHLEANDILKLFGQFNPATESDRQTQIEQFLLEKFPVLFSSTSSIENRKSKIENSFLSSRATRHPSHRLGFDVAASGQGDLAVFYIDEVKEPALWLQALLTARTEDWHFLKTVLYYFLKNLRNVQAAGDESGLGRQICWDAAQRFGSRFLKVNFASKKSDLGFALMNQLSVSEKRFPKNHQDIAADFFALRKVFNGTRWIFTEGRNTFNPASHCDIAWAGALSTFAHTERKCCAGAAVLLEDGTVFRSSDYPDAESARQAYLMHSDDPRIWRRLW
jgi:phage FluMu gp28-like protein